LQDRERTGGGKLGLPRNRQPQALSVGECAFRAASCIRKYLREPDVLPKNRLGRPVAAYEMKRVVIARKKQVA
jgi:hypothetical protein